MRLNSTTDDINDLARSIQIWPKTAQNDWRDLKLQCIANPTFSSYYYYYYYYYYYTTTPIIIIIITIIISLSL